MINRDGKVHNSTGSHFFADYHEVCSSGRDLVIPFQKNLVKLATLVEGNPKALFLIATIPMCRGGRYSVSWIAPLYP